MTESKNMLFKDHQGIAKVIGDLNNLYPYLTPVKGLEKYQQRWQKHRRRLADIHLFSSNLPYYEEASILDAGYGTSQAAKDALRQVCSQVIRIDCSKTSLTFTRLL
jgi:hypothetical protein